MKIFIILLLISSAIFSLEITFQKDYDLLKGYYVQQLHDESYVVCTNETTTAQIVKMDRFGEVEWKKQISVATQTCPNAIESADGNILYVSNENKEVCLTKISNAGVVLWKRNYNSGLGDYGLRLQHTEDGGLLIAGVGVRTSRNHIILMKMDSKGNLLWQKSYYFKLNEFKLPFPGLSLLQEENKIYILAHNFIYNIASNGDSVNTLELSSQADNFVRTADGYIISGLKYLSRVTESGEVIWSKWVTSSFIAKEHLFICRTNDNDIVCTGLFGYSKYSVNGDTLWTVKNYRRSNYVAATKDGGFIITGGYDRAPCLWVQKVRIDGFYSSIKLLDLLKGAVLSSGTEYKVQWSKNNVDYVDLQFSSDNGLNWNYIAQNIDTTLYIWKLPYINSTTCRIKVTDDSKISLPALSEQFFVSLPRAYDTISINNVKMWVGSDGKSSHDPVEDGAGGYWQNISTIFVDGLIWGGKKNGNLHVGGSTYRSGLKTGRFPGDTLIGVYKIRRDMNISGDEDAKIILHYSYDNWPGEHGAPFKDVNNDGQFTRGFDIPGVLGDETLWFVANDYDTATSRWIYGSDPIGIEIQSTTYAYNTNDELADVVFRKYKLINKSDNEVTDMYLGYWSDPDMGYADDDFVGCDTILNLGFAYNGDNDDYFYGINPPAVGYKILQGPVIDSPGDSAIFKNKYFPDHKNLPLTAFHFYIGGSPRWADPPMGVPEGTSINYQQMQGKLWDGSNIIDPLSGKITRFPLSGDPVTGIGWYEGPGWPGGESPGDRRFLMSSGPFNLAVQDTQEIVIAFIAARGTSNINSITELKKKARFVQEFYNQQILTRIKSIKAFPLKYELSQNYPNPFNPSTTIIYSVPEKTNVEMIVYDILGKKVTSLVKDEKPAGEYRINFNASELASGVYYYQLRTKDYTSARKMLLVK